MNAILNTFLLSLTAGLATGLGGLIAVLFKPGRRSFGLLMGFAGGVMISLSFLELVNEAWQMSGFLVATAGFGLGALFMFLIDVLAPHIRFGETEQRGTGPGRGMFGRHGRHRHRGQITNPDLLRTGLLIAIGISIHNTPEGIAVGAGYAHAPRFGLFIALAIALHNIPEGMATALPLCQAGVCRTDSVRTALLSGLAEPIGAVVAALLLTSFTNLIPAALAFAGGVMVFITLDELMPAAREYGHQHFTAMGMILGAIGVFLLSGILGV